MLAVKRAFQDKFQADTYIILPHKTKERLYSVFQCSLYASLSYTDTSANSGKLQGGSIRTVDAFYYARGSGVAKHSYTFRNHEISYFGEESDFQVPYLI